MAQSDEADFIIKRFSMLPAQYNDRVIQIIGVYEWSEKAKESECEALSMKIGNTLIVGMETGLPNLHMYASGKIAARLMDEPHKSRLRITVRTRYGVEERVIWGSDGPITEKELITALLIEDYVLADNEL